MNMATGEDNKKSSVFLTPKQREEQQQARLAKMAKIEEEQARRLAGVARKIIEVLIKEEVTVKETDLIWRGVQAKMNGKIDTANIKVIMDL